MSAMTGQDRVIVYRAGGIDARVKHITHTPESELGNRVSLCGARITSWQHTEIRHRFRVCRHCQRLLAA